MLHDETEQRRPVPRHHVEDPRPVGLHPEPLPRAEVLLHHPGQGRNEPDGRLHGTAVLELPGGPPDVLLHLEVRLHLEGRRRSRLHAPADAVHAEVAHGLAQVVPADQVPVPLVVPEAPGLDVPVEGAVGPDGVVAEAHPAAREHRLREGLQRLVLPVPAAARAQPEGVLLRDGGLEPVPEGTVGAHLLQGREEVRTERRPALRRHAVEHGEDQGLLGVEGDLGEEVAVLADPVAGVPVLVHGHVLDGDAEGAELRLVPVEALLHGLGVGVVVVAHDLPADVAEGDRRPRREQAGDEVEQPLGLLDAVAGAFGVGAGFHGAARESTPRGGARGGRAQTRARFHHPARATPA